MSDHDRTLFDRAEIHDALMRYCRGVDRCDESLVRSAFHEDSFDDHGYWKGNGWDFARFIVDDIGQRAIRTTHALANIAFRRVVHDWSARPSVVAQRTGLALDAFSQGERGKGDPSYADRTVAQPQHDREQGR